LPMLGVLLGAALGGGFNYWLRPRDERADTRAALRLLVPELERIETTLDLALRSERVRR